MSETGETRRRRRTAQDGDTAPAQQTGDAYGVSPYTEPVQHDAPTADGGQVHRRRQSVQAAQPVQPTQAEQPAQEEQPTQAEQLAYEAQLLQPEQPAHEEQPAQAEHPAQDAPGEAPVRRSQQDNSGAAQRRKAAQKRRVKTFSRSDAKGYAGKAIQSARDKAAGVGALLAHVYEESCAPAVREARKKLGAYTGRRTKRAGSSRRRSAYASAGAMIHSGEEQLSPAQARRQKLEKDKRRREDTIRRVLSVVLCCVACYSLFMIGSILWRTIRTNRLTDELSRMRREAQQTQEPVFIIAADGEETPGPGATPAPEAPEASPAPTATPRRTPTPTPRPLDTVRSTAFHKIGGDALPGMEELYNKNRDLIAWMTIEEVLDLPVVYRDNSYYLTHDFYKNKSTAGTLFLDVNHPFKEKTQNLLLHGHNMKDGTMFGRLAQYEQDVSYVKNHPFIDFDTLWRKERYVIFAVLHVSLDVKSEDFFNYYSYPTFSSDASFESYVRQLQLRSMYAIPVDVEPGDALLTLSTCLDEDRLVIVARRVRENESRSELKQLVRLATRQ